MFVLQGDTRVADIFLAEFMCLFNQCIKRDSSLNTTGRFASDKPFCS